MIEYSSVKRTNMFQGNRIGLLVMNNMNHDKLESNENFNFRVYDTALNP